MPHNIIRFVLCFSIIGILSMNSRAQNPTTSKDSLRVYKNDQPVVIEAERPISAVGDKQFRAADFALRPRNSAQDMLRLVPGLIIAQHAGGGKAEQIFLRGFDCDHGTDVNISVDDAPVNMISHGHGQGYADLHFIIPEVIQSLDVVKGPYMARYGDLATAGVVAFNTLDSLKENTLKFEGGAFSTYRAEGLLKGPALGGSVNSYFAAEVFSSRGYFDSPQNFLRVNMFGKATSAIGEDGKLTASIMSFSSGWDANGQIPQSAVTNGQISRFGSLDPTEGGATSRTTGILSYTSGGNSPFSLTASFTDYHFRLYSDFTFFAQDSVHGDEREQTDNRSLFALRAERKLSWELGSAAMRTTFGATLRNDNIQAQLFHDTARVRLDTKIDALIAERQIGPYAQQDIILPWAEFLLGVRADYLNIDVANRLDPKAQPNGIKQQFLVSPKATVIVPVGPDVTLFANSGFGFHSNDARVIVQSAKDSTIPRAFGAEFGFRYGHVNNFISGSIALWRLDLESELVYSGDEGDYSPQGRTKREGVDVEVRLNPFEWLTIGGDATFSHGRFVDLAEGNNFIALAPTITLTANAVAHFDAFSSALRLRHVGDRPANQDNSVVALGYSVFDLSASYRFATYELYVNIENLLDVSWNEAQFETNSRIKVAGLLEPTSVDQLHFTAGTPRSVRAGIALHF
ncbi:MAG: TonB-dependent receptor plug domain-containing protein [Candidatus Kapaibacterium sp.]